MNKQRRKSIDEINVKVDSLRDELEQVESDEQEYFDSMPEAFQTGEKGETSQAALDSLREAIDALESAASALSEAVQ